MKKHQIDALESVKSTNFWFKAKASILSILAPPQTVPTVLEVGCGNGLNLKAYQAAGAKAFGFDMSETAISYCQRRGISAFQVDASNDPLPQIESPIDLILALDFIEHVENPVEVLAKVRHLANNQTKLIVMVPAYQFLYSQWDASLGHKKRYTRHQLHTELSLGGWDVAYSSYFHLPLVIPALLVRKILKPLISRFRKNNTEEQGEFPNFPLWVDKLMSLYYQFELGMIKRGFVLPLGLSILVLASPQSNEVEALA